MQTTEVCTISFIVWAIPLNLPSMTRWLYKLLLATLSFSFFLSATETDVGEIHNTFFDQFDTYTKSDDISVEKLSLDVKEKFGTGPFIAGLQEYWFISNRDLATGIFSLSFVPRHSFKLFVRHCIWRI